MCFSCKLQRMENKENDIVNMSLRIPESTYQTLLAYKNRFKPHLSLNALVVEAILEQATKKAPEVQT